MNVIQAGLLGALQGLTEFLPVSSSGHLVIAQSLIPDFSQPGVLFDVILHAGTLVATVIYFRKTLMSLDRKYLTLLFIGSIPALFVGLLFQDLIEGVFSVTKIVGIALLVTAFVNYMTDKAVKKKTGLNYLDSLIIGVFQAFAIIPGISRSGATIFAGTKIGIDRKKAAEFSFLLSLPAIFGAGILQLTKYYSDISSGLAIYFTGFIFALFTGYIAIFLVIKTLQSKKFIYFAMYCAIITVIYSI